MWVVWTFALLVYFGVWCCSLFLGRNSRLIPKPLWLGDGGLRNIGTNIPLFWPEPFGEYFLISLRHWMGDSSGLFQIFSHCSFIPQTSACLECGFGWRCPLYTQMYCFTGCALVSLLLFVVRRTSFKWPWIGTIQSAHFSTGSELSFHLETGVSFGQGETLHKPSVYHVF